MRELFQKIEKKFEYNIDIDKIIEECKNLCIEEENYCNEYLDDENINIKSKNIEKGNDFSEALFNDQILDFEFSVNNKLSSIVKRRENIMSIEEYCVAIRSANAEQKQLIYEIINRIVNETSKPIQIFFTGPAGSGKTFTLKLIMETYNRFSNTTNDIYNTYISCACTGKAASLLNGTTVHSAFIISMSKITSSMSILNPCRKFAVIQKFF